MTSLIIDLSSNNHPGTAPIDWAQVKAAGVTGAIVKATQGTTYTNPWYERDVAGAVSVGIPVIAYHFASFTTALAEARHFASVAGLRARVLDSETNATATWQNDFLSALGGPETAVMDYGAASTLPSGAIRGLLWEAAWGTSQPQAPCWQFTDAGSVAGITGPVDESRWLGTQDQFDALFGVSTHPTPAPSPAPAPAPTPAPPEVHLVTVKLPELAIVTNPPNPWPKTYTAAVKSAQELLIRWGFSVGATGADGRFGNATKAAVVAFQQSRKITDTGIIGPQTWPHLVSG